MAYLLGIDIGTSGTKALIIDTSRNGAVLGSATVTYPLYTPKPLWAEQNPEDWWRAAISATCDAIQSAGVDPNKIGGVGLTGQMHGAVFLNSNDQVLRPSILWCDQRTGAECESITQTVGAERVIELISNPVLTGFTAGKIIWLRNNEPAIYAKVKKVLLPKDYIRLKLTGDYATDVSDASGTALFDVTNRKWSDEMLDALDIPREWMPTVYESPEITGHISDEASELTGIEVGTPVVAGGGDQAAGAVGNGIVEPGIVSSTIGTSGVVFAYSDQPVVDPELRVHTFCHAVPGKWHVMGVILSAGGSLRWFRDTFADSECSIARNTGSDPYDILSEEAATVPPGCEGLIFLPYLTGERTPYPDPYARGVFFGVTLRHTKAHFARAVLEGVAFAFRDSFEILRDMNVPIGQVRASGGGARSALWRQIQSDVIGMEHVSINIDEGPAFGAALLAGVGVGEYSSVSEACAATIKVEQSIQPVAADKLIYDRNYNVYRSLYQSLKGNFRSLVE